MTIRILASAACLLVFSTALAVVSSGSGGQEKPSQAKSYEQEISDWRKERSRELTSEDGWLSLAGLFWLKDGENKVGRDPASDIVLPSPNAPSYACSIWLEGGKARVVAPASSEITSDGKPVTSLVLQNDLSGKATVLRMGSLSFHIIKRSDKFGLRLRDKDSPARINFAGINYYPLNPAWKIEGRFEPYNPPKTLKIVNVLGMVMDAPCAGAIVFSVGGHTYRLDAEKETAGLFIMMADQTTGKETYHSGRYLYVPTPSADGKVVIDFNKAQNPPCAYTKFATCPLPPPQNRLALAVDAGEKYEDSH